MDGGRVLRAFLWNRRRNIISATKTASKIGQFIGYGMMILGFIQILLLGSFGGFWFILIGSFLNTAARKSYVQTVNEVALSHINISDLVRFQKFVIPDELPVIDAIKDYFMHFNQSYFPVVKEPGNVVGIIHLNDVKKVPMEQRYRMLVGEIMKDISEFPVVYENETGKEAMKRFVELQNLPHVAVVKQLENENIIGYVGETEIINALKFWELHAELK